MTQTTDYLARPFGTLSDLLRMHAAERPDAVALIKDDLSLSYAGLEKLIDQIVRAFARAHIQRGDSIAICALSSIDYAATFLAGLRAGIAVAPLPPSATPNAIADMVADCGAKLLFIDTVVGTALADTPLACPLISCDDSSFGLAFSAWLADVPTTPVADVGVDPKTPFNIIYSSGTTGTPKGIVQSHKMRWSHINRGASQGYGPDSVTLLSTPLYSNTTLVSFFPTLALGGCAVLMDKFDVARYLMLAEKHRVTHTMLVPVQYRRLMEYPEFDRFDLSSFEMKFCTSAPFPAALKADILARWPGGLIEFYGMTEGGGGCALVAHQFPDKLHTVGKPMFGADVRLIDDDGHEVPIGSTGEIVGRSPAVMNGYWNRPDKTAETVWLDAEGNAFIRTGDVGRFDEDGFLTLMDRKKDMIISGGFNIYPSDLEAVILAHPQVSDVGVVGVPSDAWGETPVAFVIADGGDAQEIRTWANARLGKTQRLAAVVVVDTLPRSAIGKLLKRELRDSYGATTRD